MGFPDKMLGCDLDFGFHWTSKHTNQSVGMWCRNNFEEILGTALR